MDDLSLLPEEAREALAECERATAFMFAADSFDIIRAELLRLAALEHAWQQWIKDGMRVEFLPPEMPK